MAVDESSFMALVRAIVEGESASALRLLEQAPELATARAVLAGATRQNAADYYFRAIEHYLYVGDTALHMAAAAYRLEIVAALISAGADVDARNRRGASPLHYAADGIPGSANWRPEAQAATIARLIDAGADPNASDTSGVTPLHRAVRTRCAVAVRALLDGGADGRRANKNGSTPWKLATQLTGRGGSGSLEAKEQQELIVGLLQQRGISQ